MKREREKGRKGGGQKGRGGNEGERGGKRNVENGKDEISPPPTHPHTHPLSTTRIPTYPTSISQMRYQVPTNPPPSRASVSG